MNQNIPSDTFELLKNAVNGDFDEHSINFQNFGVKGENFAGDIIFVTITNTTTKESQDIVIKQQILLNGNPLKYTVTSFDNEINFYRTIWPTLQNCYHKATGKTIEIAPKCVGTLNNELKKIALENLRLQNFVTYDKRKPFDHEHFHLILNTFGVFHAISMALKEQNVEEYNKLVRLLVPVDEIAFNNDTFGGKVLKLVSHQFQKVFDLKTDAALIEKLKLYEENGPEIVDRCRIEGKSNGVILHGDSWSNNFMFNYDESAKLKDIRIFDFQLVFSGSPVFDLSFLIYSGGSAETFKNLDYYLRIYHSSLTNTLKEFNLNAEQIYSFSELKKEWKKYCKYGYAWSVKLWNMILAHLDDIELAETGDIKPFKIAEGMQEEFEQRIKDLILHMFENDFL